MAGFEMVDTPYVRYARTLAFRNVDPVEDSALLIRFGRDLYRESLGRDTAFFRDFGRYGAGFPAAIAEMKKSDDGLVQILEEDGAPIGFSAVGLDESDTVLGRLHHLYVVADHRGQGFGGILEESACLKLRDYGRMRARLNVGARNARAIRFYEAQGWTRTASRGGLVWMERRL